MAILDRLVDEKAKLEQRLREIDGILAAQADLERLAAKVLGDVPDGAHERALSGSQHIEKNYLSEDRVSLSSVEDRLHSTEVIRTLQTGASSSRSQPRRRRSTPEVAEFELVAREILQRATHPLDRKDMHKEFLNRGFLLAGSTEREQINLLGTRMSRMLSVENIRQGNLRGYWLTERPLSVVALRRKGIDDLL